MRKDDDALETPTENFVIREFFLFSKIRRSYNIYGVDQLAIVDAAVPDPTYCALFYYFYLLSTEWFLLSL